MKIRQPWLIKLLGLLVFGLIRCWIGTLHYRLIQLNPEAHPTDPRRKKVIYALWHESILFPTRYRVTIHVLISHHTDGELIAQVCRHLGFKTVRGSSRRGGAEALRKLMKSGQATHLMVTPDGPRGPRREVQPGLIFLAAHTGLPIIPVGVAYPKAWRCPSWDRFALPWPWTQALGVIGTAIHIPARIGRHELEPYRKLVETRMLETTALAERLATGEKAKTGRRGDEEKRRQGDGGEALAA